jgi:cytochrome d ubiquinol oxidase subunit II
LGNVLYGIPLGEGFSLQGHWLQFLHPYALLVGGTTLSLFMMHGAIYLTMKTEGRLFARVNQLLRRSMTLFILLFSLTTLVTLLFIPHLSDRFRQIPWLGVVPLLAVLSIANIPRLVTNRKYGPAFAFSSLTVSLLLFMVAIELYPVLILSTVDPKYHLTVHNAAASPASLSIMLTIAAIGAPLVLAYTAFVFYTFRGKVRMDDSSY